MADRPTQTGGVLMDVSADDRREAWTVARQRAATPDRMLSPTRPSAAGPTAQYRGALGEVMALRWLTEQGLAVEGGFEADSVSTPDLVVSGVGIEVMTAQLAHREATGFCVPPNKLWGARQRGATAYLFVGVDGSSSPDSVTIQAWCGIDDVDLDGVTDTKVRAGGIAVANHVVRPSRLHPPGTLAAELGLGSGDETDHHIESMSSNPDASLKIDQAAIGRISDALWPGETVETKALALAEECGEVARAVVKAGHAERGEGDRTAEDWEANLRLELAQVVVVAFGIAERKGFDLAAEVAKELESLHARAADLGVGAGCSEKPSMQFLAELEADEGRGWVATCSCGWSDLFVESIDALFAHEAHRDGDTRPGA